MIPYLRNNKSSIWIFSIACVVFALFYFILPYSIWEINKLDDGRNYFTAINAYATYLIGLLGVFYYFDKKSKDNYHRERDSRRQYIHILLTELKEYDALVEKILCKDVRSKIELQMIRTKIEKCFDDVQIIVGNKLLPFDMEELKVIVKINSFIEKNDLIMRDELILIKKSDLTSHKENYRELLRRAKHTCHCKLG
jgi:hypothetical protein